MRLSDATILDRTNAKPISFTTNVLIVGGAYAGLSAVNTFISQFKAKTKEFPHNFSRQNMLSITLVEPRAGLLNVLGMPRCIVDSEFAETQYVLFDRLTNFKIDRVVSSQENLFPGNEPSDNNQAGINVNFVHGKVTYLDDNKAQYSLIKADNSGVSDEIAMIDFDYVILASGRDRNWPTTPKAFTYDSFIQEMRDSMNKIDAHQTISIIGAGAVGIELAGDLLHYRKGKNINLIHPHSSFPPEPLHDEFKKLTLDSLQNAGVNIITNTRIKAPKTIDLGTTTGDLETTDGQTIRSDLNIWCTAHQNNTDFLASNIKQKFVSAKNDIYVNEYLQLANETQTVANFFVLGDLVNLPIVKSAGWALYHGRQVANNLTSLILENKLVETSPDPTQIPKGMVLVAGNGDLICELAGVVSTNVPDYVEEYKDYCFGKIRATLDV